MTTKTEPHETLGHAVDAAIERRRGGERLNHWVLSFITNPERSTEVISQTFVPDDLLELACDEPAARVALVRAVRDVTHRTLEREDALLAVRERFESRRKRAHRA